MSRSYKKTSICGYTKKESDKPGKVMINKRIRSMEKRNIGRALKNDSLDNFFTTSSNSIFKYGYLPKDGKQYLNIDDFEDKDYFRKCIQK